MLRVYGHYNFLNFFRVGIDFYDNYSMIGYGWIPFLDHKRWMEGKEATRIFMMISNGNDTDLKVPDV